MSGEKKFMMEWTTASFDFHQMAVHKRTTMLAHCNLKQNLCSKQSSFFPFMHCPLVANRKTRWSIVDTIVAAIEGHGKLIFVKG